MKQKANTASLLLGVGRIIKTRLAQELPLGLTHCETLRLIAEAQPLAMRGVAEYLHITAPSATAIVGDLVHAHLVARAENRKDRREVMLRLTPLGKKTLAGSEKKRVKVLANVLSVLTDKDRAQFDRILEKILSQETV